MNHLLIDFENVQPTSLDGIEDKENTQIWLFLGVHQQKTLPYPLIKSLFHFPSSQVHFIEMQRTGKNALDHYLAFYLGKISQMDSHAQVGILARDSGYDILVEHLNATHHGLQIQRFSELSLFHYVQDKTNLSTLIDKNANHLPILPDKSDTPSQTEYASQMATAYQQVVAELKRRIATQDFIPSKKANFLSALQKYFLADLLEDWENDEQFLFAQKLFARLINYRLLEVKDDGNTLIYRLDNESLRENVANQVVLAKPKTVEKLTNVLKIHMNLLQMPSDELAIATMMDWLKEQTYIYQNGNLITYELPVAIPVSTISPPSTTQPTPLNKALKLLEKKENRHRPTKLKALTNDLLSHLKIPQADVEQLICDLEKSKKLTIPKQGKISYHF